MSVLSAVIAEDEANLRRRAARNPCRALAELVIRAEARDGLEACKALEQHAPDVSVLDIQIRA